jgi:type I restriction modification DNA specificity domain protein
MTKKPSYRFVGYTEPWEQRKLGECTEISAGGDIEKSKLLNNGKYPVIANALTSDGIVGYYNDSYRIEAPAVTVTGRGDVGVAKARNVNFTPVVRLLSLKSEHDVIFLENAINTQKIVIESTGVPQLTAPQLGRYKIFFPSLPEQTAIGSFFQDIDQLISLQQRKLEVLKEQKKTYLKLLFPAKGQTKPALRFAGFEDDWKEVKLGEVASHRSGTSIEKYFAENGVYKVISIGSYGLDGEYIDQGIRAISNEVTDKKIVKENELTMVLNDKTSNGTIIGRTLLIKSSNEFVVNQRTEIISPKEILDSQYAYVLLNGNFREQVKKIVQGGTQIYVNYSSVEQLKLPLPSFPEQQAIGSFFQDLDKAVAKQEEKVNQLKESKQTLLRKMFI